MGRHYKIPKLSYISKKARIAIEEEAKRRRTQALPAREKEVCLLLQGFAIDVLEAAGRGYAVDETPYMGRIMQVVHDG